MPATFAITNEGTEDATYELKISYPIGTQGNPAELVIGTNTATIAEGNNQGYYYKWTTFSDGTLTLTVASDTPVQAELRDGDSLLFSSELTETATISVAAPHLWSAEDPYLYDLILSADGEFVRHRIGFRESVVENGVFKINGKHIKLYGVNRHDSNPDTG